MPRTCTPPPLERGLRAIGRAALATVATSLTLAWLGSAAAVALPQPPLSHAGRWITDAQGRVVILHGFNMVNKLPPYYPAAIGFNAEDVKFLAENGFNTVRLGIIWKALEPEPGVYDDEYLAHIAQTVQLLGEHGIFTLLDFHQDMYNEAFEGEGAPDWAVQDDGLPTKPGLGFPDNYFFMTSLWRTYDHFWQNAPGPGGMGLQDYYAAAWAHVAAFFRDDPSILGYDIFNEPFPGSQYTSCANPLGCPVFDAELTAFTRRVFTAIRGADPVHLLWYEPNVVFNDGAQTHVGNPGDTNSGFDFHDYCLVSAFLPSLPGSPTSDQPQSCEVLEKLVFENAEAQSQRTGGALLLSEFGAGDNLAPLERLVNDADQFMVSWEEWAFWNRDPSAYTPSESLIRNLEEPPTGENVKWEKLAVLERPYPQAVAGTPLAYGYTPSTDTFTLSYSTAPPPGMTLASGALTEVNIPKLHYPHGYEVTVSGARVVSPPDSSTLLLENEVGAAKVSVTVVPAA